MKSTAICLLCLGFVMSRSHAFVVSSPGAIRIPSPSALVVLAAFPNRHSSNDRSTTTNSSNDRRSFLVHASAIFLSTVMTTTSSLSIASAMEGEDFSNDFIQTLKARSEEKSQEYQTQVQNGKTAWKKMDTAKFSSQYNRPSFVGIQRDDKTFKMVTLEQLESLKKEGKVFSEYETKIDKKGKEYIDYQQGELLKFTNE